MGAENIKQGSEVTERVAAALKRGDNQKALELLEQNFGAMAKNLMENTMKYSTLSQNELARVFAKVSDILENVADKMDKNERLSERKEKADKTAEEAARQAEVDAAKQAAAARQQRFEERLNWLEQQKRQLFKEQEDLKRQHRKEKNQAKRRIIEEKLKKLDERRRHLEEERQKLENIKKDEPQQTNTGSRPINQTGEKIVAASNETRENSSVEAYMMLHKNQGVTR